jgi:hypothetical protein
MYIGFSGESGAKGDMVQAIRNELRAGI